MVIKNKKIFLIAMTVISFSNLLFFKKCSFLTFSPLMSSTFKQVQHCDLKTRFSS